MARFIFTLQAVLEQRERMEQQRQRVVAELEVERLRLEGMVRECQRGIVAERESQRRHLGAGDLGAARSQAAAAARLDTRAQRIVVELAGLCKRLEAARAELLEASKARKAVELLKQHRYEEWRREQERRDAAAIDELAVMQAARKERAL